MEKVRNSVLVIVAILLVMALVGAHAKTYGPKLYEGPDDTDYYDNTHMPDNPSTPCCGVADAYWADDTEQAPDGSIIAVITDTRPDSRTLPDGRKIEREHIPVGTRIPVPPYKLRKHPIPNPTGHTVIWLGSPSEDPDSHYHIVYCYEPQALL